MDLLLTSDFDSALLNWDEDDDNDDSANNDSSRDGSSASSNARQHTAAAGDGNEVTAHHDSHHSSDSSSHTDNASTTADPNNDGMMLSQRNTSGQQVRTSAPLLSTTSTQPSTKGPLDPSEPPRSYPLSNSTRPSPPPSVLNNAAGRDDCSAQSAQGMNPSFARTNQHGPFPFLNKFANITTNNEQQPISANTLSSPWGNPFPFLNAFNQQQQTSLPQHMMKHPMQQNADNGSFTSYKQIYPPNYFLGGSQFSLPLVYDGSGASHSASFQREDRSGAASSDGTDQPLRGGAFPSNTLQGRSSTTPATGISEENARNRDNTPTTVAANATSEGATGQGLTVTDHTNLLRRTEQPSLTSSPLHGRSMLPKSQQETTVQSLAMSSLSACPPHTIAGLPAGTSTPSHIPVEPAHPRLLCPNMLGMQGLPNSLSCSPFVFNPIMAQAASGTPLNMAMHQQSYPQLQQPQQDQQFSKPVLLLPESSLASDWSTGFSIAYPNAPASRTIATTENGPTSSTHHKMIWSPPQLATDDVPSSNKSQTQSQAELQPRPKKLCCPSSSSPSLLIDASRELRQNFLQSQRLHNISGIPDNNPFRYDMAVNGFHPQHDTLVYPTIMPSLSGTEDSGTTPSLLSNGISSDTSGQFIDERNRNAKLGATTSGCSGKDRNEREQRRAAKISDLIEKLRLSMVGGGWKVEMKSKYHILSTCADYVKHLMKTTKEKEAAVEKAKSDLLIREQKLEDDYYLRDARSDPDSGISSLTASITPSGTDSGKELPNEHSVVADTSEGNDSLSSSGEDQEVKKCKFLPRVSGDSSMTTELQPANVEAEDDGELPSTDFFIGEMHSDNLNGQGISFRKMSSTVSDITNTNRSSLLAARSSENQDNRQCHSVSGKSNKDEPSITSIPSTAAVASGVASRERHYPHSEVAVTEKAFVDRKRKHRKLKSYVDNKFDLNYKEFFLTSNVPQLISTTAGRIVTWNKFFLTATGLTETEVKHLTIFSIVQADKLASLFEFVAKALRMSATRSTIFTDKSSVKSSERETSMHGREINYSTVTLPCIQFSSRYKIRSLENASSPPISLYLKVILLNNSDPDKRCLHCVLTDNPGTNGVFGSVTPNLLALMCTVRSDGKSIGKKRCRDDKK